MIKHLQQGAGLFGLVAVVAAVALFAGRDQTTAQNYFNPCGTLALAATTANTPSNITGNFGIGLDPATCGRYAAATDRAGEWNSGGLIYFTPPEWKVAKDADIPDGTEVGSFKSEAVLGILNNGCATVLNVNFKLLDGTIDRSKPVDALPIGQGDRLKTMAVLDANGVPAAATGWPSYLNTVADNDHVGMDLTKLVARFVGVNNTDVIGTTVVLNFLIFEPGAQVSKRIQLDPALGYPAVTILQDPSGTAASSDPVSDFCAPLWTESTLNGTVGTTPFRTNPGDGIYNFVSYVVPAPDADNDGIENGLDPCPYIANASGWDPRAPLKRNPPTVGDQDLDGLPNDCDPFPDVASTNNCDCGAANSDEDGDGWMNRGDNCALAANPDQMDTDSDAIGDVCDTNTNIVLPETVDGRNPPICLVSTVTIGAGGAAPSDPRAMAPCNPSALVPTGTQGPQATVGPTPTFIPGTTFRPTLTPVPGGQTGVIGQGPPGGIGSLSPTGSDIPTWAAIFAALGALGLAFGLSVTGSRIWRRR